MIVFFARYKTRRYSSDSWVLAPVQIFNGGRPLVFFQGLWCYPMWIGRTVSRHQMRKGGLACSSQIFLSPLHFDRGRGILSSWVWLGHDRRSMS